MKPAHKNKRPRTLAGIRGGSNEASGIIDASNLNGNAHFEVLSPPEATRLKECEVWIEDGVQAMIEAGNALLEIRDCRLYRESHKTFEMYLKERWGKSRSYAHRLIEAASIASDLLPMGNKLPSNERQTRALSKVKYGWLRGVAWQAALDRSNGSPTGTDIEKVISDLMAPIPFGMGMGKVDGVGFLVHIFPDEKIPNQVELAVWRETGEVDVEGDPAMWGWKEIFPADQEWVGQRIRERLAQHFPPKDWDVEQAARDVESEGLSILEARRRKEAVFIRHALQFPIEWL